MSRSRLFIRHSPPGGKLRNGIPSASWMKVPLHLGARISLSMFDVTYHPDWPEPWHVEYAPDAGPTQPYGVFSSLQEALRQARHRANNMVIR